MGAEVFHALKGMLVQAAGSRPPSATRAASRRTSSSNEAALEILIDGDRGRRLRARARTSRSPSTRRPASSTRTAPTSSSTRGARSPPRRWPTTGRTSATRYPIVSIEDGMDEEDWDGWKRAHRAARRPRASSSATTSSSPTPSACARGIERGVGNSILVKVNQIGTLTETLEAIAIAREAGYTAVISHRSGRDRGHDDRRPRGRHRRRPDQDRRAVALGPRGQVQPAAADRGGARASGRSIPGLRRSPAAGEGSGAPAAAEPWQRARMRARTATVDATAAQAQPAARRGASRIHWDRVGRVALVLVLFAVLYSYLNPAIELRHDLQGDRRHRSPAPVAAARAQAARGEGASLRTPTPRSRQRAGWAWSQAGERAYVVKRPARASSPRAGGRA